MGVPAALCPSDQPKNKNDWLSVDFAGCNSTIQEQRTSPPLPLNREKSKQHFSTNWPIPYRGGAILVWCRMRDRLYEPSSVPVSREITLCLFSRRCRSWLSCPLSVQWGSISSKDSRTEFGSSRQRAINFADKPGPIACLMIPGSMKENSPTTPYLRRFGWVTQWRWFEEWMKSYSLLTYPGKADPVGLKQCWPPSGPQQGVVWHGQLLIKHHNDNYIWTRYYCVSLRRLPFPPLAIAVGYGSIICCVSNICINLLSPLL